MNATDPLKLSLDWLHQLVTSSVCAHKEQGGSGSPGPFHLPAGESFLLNFIAEYQLNDDQVVLLLLALIPHLVPDFFSKIISDHFPQGGDFPEFGGVKAGNHRGILPTGETAQFVLGGNDLQRRTEVRRLLSGDHWFGRKRILWLEQVREGEPAMSGRLILEPEVVDLLVLGAVTKPRFSADFPAENIETQMAWEDVSLHPNTQRQLEEIQHWLLYNDTLLKQWGMGNRIKPGYRALFYGPPGTGKTLTATLLGKHTGRDVYRIDLSRVVSKYIGETEKNLARLFDKAEHKSWILFFDEADALFGRRTDIRDAHDKHANQEVAYLLQRIENYHGLVILATNQRSNIDDAFIRRFQSIIHFPVPRPEERFHIWRKAFPSQIEIAEDIVWRQVSARYELSGAGIMNIAHYCALELLATGNLKLNWQLLENAILREYIKEGRVI